MAARPPRGGTPWRRRASEDDASRSIRRADIPIEDRPDAADLKLTPDLRDRKTSWLGVAQVFLVSAAAAAATWMFGFATALYVSPPSIAAPPNAPTNFQLFSEAWRWIDLEFYGEPPLPHARASHAVGGLVEGLDDPYAAYVNRARLIENQADFASPELNGVGAWLEMVAEGALVVSTYDQSPARRAGLEPGDVIASADGEPLAGLPVERALQLLEGPDGSSVELVVLRQRETPVLVEIVRDHSVRTGTAAVVRRDHTLQLILGSFTAQDLEMIDDLLAETEPSVNFLLLDLRDNPGGQLGMMPDFVGRFVDEGVAYVEVTRDHQRVEYPIRRARRAESQDFWKPERIAILVNEGTASAAEILATAIREQSNARVLGRTSFGKGRIQGIIRLSDDSLFRLTVASWETPSGASVNGVGITPDLLLDRDEAGASQDSDMSAAPSAEPSNWPAQPDPVTEAALNALESGELWQDDAG